MIGHSFAAFRGIGGALVHRAAFITYSAVGSHRGDLNLRTAHALIFCAMIALVVTIASVSRMPPLRPCWFSAVVWIVAAAVAIIMPLLLYLQFHAVGQSTIEGIEGRYFLSIVFRVMPFVPRMRTLSGSRIKKLLDAHAINLFAVVFAVVTVRHT